MTKAERVKAVYDCWGRVYARAFLYEQCGLTDEEAFTKACNESEGAPDECLEEWEEYHERIKWLVEHQDAHEALVKKALREVIAERPI